jgi:tetratricopeptide (TPR) repeat protein
MADTLNLFEHLLAQGKRLQALGRHRDAGKAYARLARFRDLPAPVAEEAQVRLAELALKRRRFAQARRHLHAALRQRPDVARYHFLMATALQADEPADLEQAAVHYRRALELGPDHVRCRCDAGLLALRTGRTEEGLALLRQAVEQSPDAPAVVGKLVKGLLLAGQVDEAGRAIRTALFRNPRSPRFRKLWADFQLRLLRRDREAEQLRRHDDEGPVLLPFVRPQPGGPTEGGARKDRPAPLASPHLPRLVRRTDQRRVQ